MSGETQAGADWIWPKRFFAVLVTAALFQTVIGIALGGELMLARIAGLPVSNDAGIRIALDPSVPVGSVRVKEVQPGSAMARAGVVAGDRIEYDSLFEWRRIHHSGDTFGVTVHRDGQSIHRLITMPAPEEPVKAPAGLASTLEVFDFLALISASLFAWLIIARRYNNPAAACLGLVTLGLALPSSFLPSWLQGDLLGVIVATLAGMTDWMAMLALPLAYYLAGDPADRVQRRRVWAGYAVACVPMAIAQTGVMLTHPLPIIGLPGILSVPVLVALYVASIMLLARNFRRNDVEQRNRIKVIGLALILFLGNSIIGFIGFFGRLPPEMLLVLRCGATLLSVAAPGLIAYAMIRKGLFDVTFAVNRTLVYGAVSLTLLCAFGLAEWAVDHLVPEEWHKAGPVYSAAIALALFLVFHRVRDFVEHRVERLFFRTWHSNEAKLREFVRASAHFEKENALAQAAVAELARFSGGAAAGLYSREGAGEYHRIAGAGPDRIDPDDHALVRARVDFATVDVGKTGSTIPASLVLPMKVHGELAGFVTLEAKPQSLGYRPDEIELLEWAAQQIGLNLQSVSARAMRARSNELELRVKELEVVLSKLAPARRRRATI